jgi:hypothetical protein
MSLLLRASALALAFAAFSAPSLAQEEETHHRLRLAPGASKVFGGVFASVQRCKPSERLSIHVEHAPTQGAFRWTAATKAPGAMRVAAVENCPVTGLKGYDTKGYDF